MLESNSYKVFGATINPNMAAYINQNSSYAYGKDREFEPHLTLNTLANPFALNA